MNYIIKLCDNYNKIISNPIDLIKISDRVNKGGYETLYQFSDYIQLMINDFLIYNWFSNLRANRDGSAFRDYYNNNFPKLIKKIQKYNIKNFF